MLRSIKILVDSSALTRTADLIHEGKFNCSDEPFDTGLTAVMSHIRLTAGSLQTCSRPPQLQDRRDKLLWPVL